MKQTLLTLAAVALSGICGAGQTAAQEAASPFGSVPLDQRKVAFVIPVEKVEKSDRDENGKIQYDYIDHRSDQEKAAHEWFKKTFKLVENESLQSDDTSNAGFTPTGKVVMTYDFDVKASEYKCVWVHIDRNDLDEGKVNACNPKVLPPYWRSATFIANLHKFMIEGGNIYLSGQAALLLPYITRTNLKYAANHVELNGETGDISGWQVGPNIKTRDHAGHPIYFGLAQEGDDKYMKISDGSSAGWNHNFGWKRENCAGTEWIYDSMKDDETFWANRPWVTHKDDADWIDKFEADNLCSVIGTFEWASNGGSNPEELGQYLMLVEFHPLRTLEVIDGQGYLTKKSGAVIVNGIASANNWTGLSTNADCNMVKFTSNVLRYLAPEGEETGPYSHPKHDKATERWWEPYPSPLSTPTNDGMPEMLESSGKIAFYVNETNESDLKAKDEQGHYKYPQEVAAYDYFCNSIMSRYPESAKVLWKGDLDDLVFQSHEDIFDQGHSGYELVWINICRDHDKVFDGISNEESYIKVENATKDNPTASTLKEKEVYDHTELVKKLKEFRKQGGNIYLTKYAVLLATELGLTETSPNHCFYQMKSEGVKAEDVWAISSHGADGYSRSNHPIFEEMDDNSQTGDIPLFSGLSTREDCNVAWHLGRMPEGQQTADGFNAAHNASILGFWNLEGDGKKIATLVEFHPESRRNGPMRITDTNEVRQRRGTVLTNGASAYYWDSSDADETNENNINMRKFTTSTLQYLSPVSADLESFPTQVETIGGADADATAQPRWFNLQGVEIPTPAGICIELRGTKATKRAF